MEKPASKLPFWKAYVRGVLLVFTALLALDWLAYVAFERWLPWPFLIPVALFWPPVMTGLT